MLKRKSMRAQTCAQSGLPRSKVAFSWIGMATLLALSGCDSTSMQSPDALEDHQVSISDSRMAEASPDSAALSQDEASPNLSGAWDQAPTPSYSLGQSAVALSWGGNLSLSPPGSSLTTASRAPTLGSAALSSSLGAPFPASAGTTSSSPSVGASSTGGANSSSSSTSSLTQLAAGQTASAPPPPAPSTATLVGDQIQAINQAIATASPGAALTATDVKGLSDSGLISNDEAESLAAWTK